jgi:H+-transporting ATPase
MIFQRAVSAILALIRKIQLVFLRMSSYAIYRIAETFRLFAFLTLTILFFHFSPLSAGMIVILAILNDAVILFIAYDNIRYNDLPNGWDMRLVLGISMVLGVSGLLFAFGLFFLGELFFHLDHSRIRTLMYLMLSLAGQLTIFLTRSRGPFWSIRHAWILWSAVLGTQILATLIAACGLFMSPIGWELALLVWCYAFVCFLISDRIKLLAYRIFDPLKTQESIRDDMTEGMSQPRAAHYANREKKA